MCLESTVGLVYDESSHGDEDNKEAIHSHHYGYLVSPNPLAS